MSGQSEESFQSPDEEATCESPYGSVTPPQNLPGNGLEESAEYETDYGEIKRVIVHQGNCTGKRPRGCMLQGTGRAHIKHACFSISS